MKIRLVRELITLGIWALNGCDITVPDRADGKSIFARSAKR